MQHKNKSNYERLILPSYPHLRRMGSILTSSSLLASSMIVDGNKSLEYR